MTTQATGLRVHAAQGLFRLAYESVPKKMTENKTKRFRHCLQVTTHGPGSLHRCYVIRLQLYRLLRPVHWYATPACPPACSLLSEYTYRLVCYYIISLCRVLSACCIFRLQIAFAVSSISGFAGRVMRTRELLLDCHTC
jgi:hypothetical protein